MDVSGVTRGIGPRDLAIVGGLAAALVVDALIEPHGDLSLAGAPAVALACVPLLWRSRTPRIVLALVTLGVIACLATLMPTSAVALPAMLATYSVALREDRRGTVVLGFIVVPTALACVLVFSDGAPQIGDLVMNGAFMLLAVATGDAVGSRRAYRRAAEQRAAEREREQRAEALRMVAEERLRIAREVHDVVAHAMVAINVQAGVAAHVLDRRPEQARAALQDIKSTSGSALGDLRTTLGLLREEGAAAPVSPTERLDAVADLATALRAAGIEVDVSVAGRPDHVAAPVGAAAYRIVQEATTNILRHAGARSATIRVDVGGDTLALRVDDDGAAMVPAGGPVAEGSGQGLRGMAERAAALGGSLEAGRLNGSGWSVRARLPLR